MKCSKYLVISCLMSTVRIGLTEENKVLKECSFDGSENCDFQIIPDLDGVHHLELWTLSPGGTLGRNSPTTDHTPGLNLDVFANSKSLETTAPHDFNNFTTKIISPVMNFTSGMGRISFYYYLWISDDPEGNAATYSSLNVKGCNGELIWTEMAFTTDWRSKDIDFPCPRPGKIMFEAVHRRPGSGVAIDDVKILEIPLNTGGGITMNPRSSPGVAPAMPHPSGSTTVMSPVSGGLQTTVAVGQSTRSGDRIIIIVVACFIGALLIFAISMTIHCYLWRRRKRSNQRHLTDVNPNGMHVSNTGYDFLTGIAGVNNGSRKSGVTESTTLSTISKGLGGSSYQMNVVSENRKGSGTFEKNIDGGIQVSSKSKRRSLSMASFKRSRSGKERSFEYSEIPDSTSPTPDENFYSFLTTRKQTNGKPPKLVDVGRTATPKLGDIGRSARMMRSNSLPSRKSVDGSTTGRIEGPYHITDLIGNISIDPTLFPSIESLTRDDTALKRKGSVQYDQPQIVQPGEILSKPNNHEYKALEPRKRSNSYDVLQIARPALISLSDESVGDNVHLYKDLEVEDNADDYDLLEPTTDKCNAPRDLGDYEKPPPPPPVSPKPISPFAPRPMSPRVKNKQPLPAVVPSSAVDVVSKSLEGPEGFIIVRDPKYYTLVPDLVRDASYDYPDMVVGDDIDAAGDNTGDADSNIYESFERPATPRDRRQRSTPNSRQNSRQNSLQTSKDRIIESTTTGIDESPKPDKRTMIKEQQLAKFLDDDYENVE